MTNVREVISDQTMFDLNVQGNDISGTKHYSCRDYIIDNCIISSEIQFTKVPYNLIFTNCVFTEKFVFPKIIANTVDFTNSVFEKDVDITEVTFEKKVYFNNVTFLGKVLFNNTKFNALADFWHTTFEEKVIFYKTDFNGTTVFSAATFKDNVLFTYSLFSKVGIFNSTDFEKGVDFSQSIISGTLNFFNIKLENFTAINRIFTKDTFDYDNFITQSGDIPIINKRETFRIIKSVLISNNNHVEAQKFQMFEIDTLHKELKLKRKELLNIKAIKLLNNTLFLIKKWIFYLKSSIKFVTDLFFINTELFLLFLNKISNKHGSSWSRGVFFTGLIAFIFYFFVELSYHGFCFEKFSFQSLNVKTFLMFINPFHDFDILSVKNSTKITYILDYTGRIFISYGIYQTVQAFRKYKNK